MALYGRDRLTAVVGFLVFGAALSVYWAVIGAPDVALAEAAIGTGVTGALFVHAATRLRSTPPARSGGAGVVAGLVCAGLLGGAFGTALTAAAARTTGLTTDVTAAMPETGVAHPVTGVLLNLRSYDTLLEVAVLLAAVAVGLAHVPDRAVASPPRAAVLDVLVRAAVPVVLLVGAWLLVAGSSRPGGAFQAGAVLAAALILLHASGVRRLPTGAATRAVLAAGLAAFLAVAVTGLALGGTWLHLRGPAAGGVIVALEAVLAVSIGAALALLYVALTGERS